MKEKKQKSLEDFARSGGKGTLKKYGAGHFSGLNRIRWDKHHGKICLNCGKYREEIESKKLPCEAEIEIIIREKKSFPEHVYNVPVKKSRKKAKDI